MQKKRKFVELGGTKIQNGKFTLSQLPFIHLLKVPLLVHYIERRWQVALNTDGPKGLKPPPDATNIF